MREQTPDAQGGGQDDDVVSMDGLEGDVAPKPKRKRGKAKSSPKTKMSKKPPPELLTGVPTVRFTKFFFQVYTNVPEGAA